MAESYRADTGSAIRWKTAADCLFVDTAVMNALADWFEGISHERRLKIYAGMITKFRSILRTNP